jgi:LAS superfamily LD-carboxypeptidase LdcB
MNELELTGRARTHIVQLDEPRCALHVDTVQPFLAMRAAAALEGIDLAVASSFRDFEAQLAIWNRKYRGERPLLDRNGVARDHGALDGTELLEAILAWSALPGASRHHWGSELDVYDRAAMPDGYRVQLVPDEYAPSGVFERLSRWLDANLARFGFFRPYDRDRGGVHAEPWHISHAQVSMPASAAVSVDLLARTLRDADILGKTQVLERLPEIFRRFVANFTLPATAAAPSNGSSTA